MTKLVLNVVDYEHILLFDAIKLKISGEEVKVTTNRIKINICYHHKYYTDYYTEIIQLYNSKDKNIIKEYKLELYFNQENIYDIILNSKNSFSFDFLIYSQNTKRLPEEIKYNYHENNYSIKEYNSFGLKKVRKFGIINCEKSWFNNIKDLHFPSYVIQGSYYVNIFLRDKDKSKTSIYKIHLYKCKSIDFNLIDEKVQNYFLEFPQKIHTYYEDIKRKSDFANKNVYFNINIRKLKAEVNEFQYDELLELKDLLSRRINLNLSEKEYNVCFGYCLYIFIYSLTSIMYPYAIYENLQSYINRFNEKIKGDLEILRFIFWYRDYILLKEEMRDKLTENIENSIYGNNKNSKGIEPFEVLLLYETEENTPYNLAVKFLEDFTNNLNEDSFILEILFLIDSEVSINRIFKNCTMFKLSMLSLKQIKQHLFLLIPKIVINYDSAEKDSSNGSFLPDVGVFRIYEGALFNKRKNQRDLNIMKFRDDTVKYTIPIIMLFLHECFCHAKIRNRHSEIDSPSYFYNPYDDYTLLFHCDKGECGRLFEFYISPNIEVIKFLKYSYVSMPELLNSEYWTSKNREKLWNYIKKKMEENKIEILDSLAYFPKNLVESKPEFAENENDLEKDIYYSDNSEDDLKFRKKLKKKLKIINCQ